MRVPIGIAAGFLVLSALPLKADDYGDAPPAPPPAAPGAPNAPAATAPADQGKTPVNSAVPASPKLTGDKALVNPEDIPETISQAAATAPALVAKLRSGELTPEEAWKTGQINEDDILNILGSDAGGVWGENGVLAGDPNLAGLLVEHYPERVKDVKALKPSVRLSLGEYYRLTKDPRVVEVLEGLIEEGKPHVTKDGVVTTAAYYLDHAMRSLAEYYVTIGEDEHAVHIFNELVLHSQSPAYMAGAMVSTASIYHQTGDDKKAQEYYDRAIGYGDTWSTGVVVFDRATDLIRQGYYEDARKLLQGSSVETKSEALKVAFLTLLGLSYYRNQKFDIAKGYFDPAVIQYASLGTRDERTQAFEQVNVAHIALKWIARWTAQPRSPIVVDPEKLHLVVDSSHKSESSLTASIALRSIHRVALTVTSDDSRVKVSNLEKRRSREDDLFTPLYFQQVITVEVASGDLAKSFSANIVLRSSELPGFEAHIPMRVAVQ